MSALFHLVRQPGRALASLTLAILVGILAANAADPPACGATSDAALAGQARSALAADPELSGLNLIVDVVHGAAEVGGPVPRMELTQRIESVLKTVPGLTSAKVTIWVPAAQDPLSRMVGQELAGTGKSRARGQVFPSTTAPPLVIVPRPELARESALIRAELTHPSDSNRVTVQRIPASEARLLLEPVGPTGIAITPLPMPGHVYPTIPPTPVPAAPASRGSLAAEVAAVKSTDPRFVALTIDVRNGTAIIAGTAHRTADAWDLATAVRRIPGVERVVIGHVNGW